MDINLFWTAFGAIGGTVGALATAVAVIVALWQTKYSQKKKVKIAFNEDVTVVPEVGSVFYRYVGVTVTNIGNRDVMITGWGFKMHNGGYVVIVRDNTPISKLIQINLPHKLAIEESIDLTYGKTYLLGVLKENIDNKKLDPHKALEFYVSDSTGKKYTVKTSKTVCEMIQQIEKQL